MALKRSRPSPSAPPQEDWGTASVSTLREQLRHAEAEQRRFAVLALGRHPETAALLVEHLKTEPSLLVREAVFTTLARLGDPSCLSGLIHCLRGEDANLRNGAIEILKLWPEHTASIIPTLLSDSNSDVRILTINILESLRHPAVEQWLLEVLDSDTHLNVCGAALDLLVEIGSQKALPFIQKVRERFSSEPYIQFAADLAVKRIKKG